MRRRPSLSWESLRKLDKLVDKLIPTDSGDVAFIGQTADGWPYLSDGRGMQIFKSEKERQKAIDQSYIKVVIVEDLDFP